MITNRKKAFYVTMAVMLVLSCVAVTAASAQDSKVGYVDLRRAFYEYDKAQEMEASLDKVTQERQDERTRKVEEITKLRDEAEMLKGDAKNKKAGEIDAKLADLQEFDRQTRQELLNKKNDMFREVIDDIQGVVEDVGKSGKYDYILDSRNIMYAKEEFDLTDQVLKKLNK